MRSSNNQVIVRNWDAFALGEPVIVCRSFFYFPLLHHTQNTSGYCLYSDGHPMPYIYGTPVMTPEDLITDAQLKTLGTRRVWVVNMESNILGISWVPVLPQWKEKSHHVFSEVARLGDVIIVEYEINLSKTISPIRSNESANRHEPLSFP